MAIDPLAGTKLGKKAEILQKIDVEPPAIQVDMFEVQLGAALLLQFQIDGSGPVRVLADAGIHGRPKDHVLKKIKALTPAVKRLDLVIGTHYDADHLDGLVPIIAATDIDIGEVWLPPVANDTEPPIDKDVVDDEKLLARQFAADDGQACLERYLESKRNDCERLSELENLAGEIAHLPRARRFLSRQPTDEFRKPRGDADASLPRNYFERQVHDVNSILGVPDRTHADESIDEPDDPETIEKKAAISTVRQARLQAEIGRLGGDRSFLAQRWRASSGAAERDRTEIAAIRGAVAKNAINAASLAEVVKALKTHRPKVPIRNEYIPEGEPTRFVWRAKTKRFIGAKSIKSEGPEFMLLGPSDRLIRHHQNKLPVGNIMFALALQRIPLKSITPSNQLSYILRLAYKNQGLLVSGDAGCVDFNLKPRSRRYHPKLLKAMLPLHVIQVAHHGGNNAHFYRVLEEAGFAKQTEPSFLLLSHATHDKHRPSKTFDIFVGNIRADGDDMKLLFTCRPQPQKVANFLEIIHAPFPEQDAGSEGDVRLALLGSGWTVLAHAVRV